MPSVYVHHVCILKHELFLIIIIIITCNPVCNPGGSITFAPWKVLHHLIDVHLYFCCFVTVDNVGLYLVFPSRNFMWSMWRTFIAEKNLKSAHTWLKNIHFLQVCKLPKLRRWITELVGWDKQCVSQWERTHRKRNTENKYLVANPLIPLKGETFYQSSSKLLTFFCHTGLLSLPSHPFPFFCCKITTTGWHWQAAR